MNRNPVDQVVSNPMDSSSSSRATDTLFVWGVWLVLLMADLAYVTRYSSDIPFEDEWSGVPHLASTGSEAVDWFWSQFGEHRAPLCKVVHWLSWQAFDGNLRLPMYLQVLALGVASGLLIWVAGRIRGTTSVPDAFFPLLLLHLYHGQNFLWSGQLYYVVAAFLFCVVTAYFAGGSGVRGFWSTLGAGLCLAVLPVQGAMGMAYSAPLSLAMACLGVAHRRMDSPEAKRRGMLMLAVAMVTWGMMGLYMVGYHQPGLLGGVNIPGMAITTVQALALGIGFLGARAWPVSGVLMVVLVLATLGLLFWAWKTRSAERSRIVTLLLTASAGIVLAVSLGIGRANNGINIPRYIILTAPLFCCIYLIWCLYGSPWSGRLMQLGLFFVSCSSLVYHTAEGYYWGEARQKADRQLLADIAAGIPVTGLVARNGNIDWSDQWMSPGLELVRERRIGHYAAVKPDPPMKSRELSLTPSAVEMTLEGDTWKGAGGKSKLVFQLDKPTWVYGIRLKFTLDCASVTERSQFQVFWNSLPEPSQARPSREESQSISVLIWKKPWTRTFWVNSKIDRFHISPGQQPFGLRLMSVELLEQPRE